MCKARQKHEWNFADVSVDAMKRLSVFELHKSFKEGLEDMKIMKEVDIRKLTAQLKMWNKIVVVIWKYWQGYVRLFIWKDLMLWSCIRIMPVFMVHLSGSFGSKSLYLNWIICQIWPCDFWLFPKLMTALKGHTVSNIAYIHGHVLTILNSIQEEEF